MKTDELLELKVSQFVSYSGEMIVMRDAAQKRLKEINQNNQKIPFSLENKIVFYAGPANPPKNAKIGAIGPTTSERMDSFLEMLYNFGVVATVGKGKRSNLAIELCKKYSRAYFLAPSGAAAYLAKTVLNIELIAFSDLGPEAVYRIKVKEFPLIIAIDKNGDQIF
ncbi:MAG TPA: FumA C-terminus/TtdB family hydratase beta subunit [Defluviitaleaceae bacterium]|nr:FumA C-terminus/TtdB family hydratase beta subunit [Defluviitaleaceae bacterium]